MKRSPDALTPIDLQLPAMPGSVTAARHELAGYLQGAGIASSDAELATTEAVANAVKHGFRGREAGTIFLRFETLVPETLAITVADDGIGMTPDPEYEGLGLGLSLIGRLVTDVTLTNRRPHGTAVTMHFRLRRERTA